MKKVYLSLAVITLLLNSCGSLVDENSPSADIDKNVQSFLKQNPLSDMGILNAVPMSDVVNTEKGYLRNKGMIFVPKHAINFKGGQITGELNGPDGTNFNLHLYRANNGKWENVGKSNDQGSKDKLTVNNLKSGKYAFLVLSKQGKGDFKLKITLGEGDDQPDNPGDIGKYPPSPYKKLVHPVTDKNFEKEIVEKSNSELVILQFSKKGCIPCEQVVAEVMDKKMRTDNDWTWGLIDGTKYTKIWEKFGNPWFPTMIALRNGKEVARRVGYNSGDQAKVTKWLDTLRSGGTPAPDLELITEVSTEEANYILMKQASFNHPVVLEFYNEESKNSKVHKDVERMVNADKGKWKLGRISSKDVKLNEGFIIAEYPSLVSLYKGKMIFRQEGERDTATTEKWIKRLYSIKYPDPMPFKFNKQNR